MVTHKLESELSSVREKLKAVRYEVEGAKKEKVEAGAMTDVVDTSEKGTMVTTEGCWERVKAAAITIETEARRYLARSRARSLWVLSGQLGDFNRLGGEGEWSL